MKRLILLTAICLSWTANAQEVQKIVPNPTLAEGIVYRLPATVVRVEVTATCTITHAGPYASYAEKLLAIKDVPTEDQVVWNIDKIALSVFGIADTTRSFTIVPSKEQPAVWLTRDNILLSINREPEYAQTDAPEPVSSEFSETSQTATPIMTEEMLKAGSVARQAEAAAAQIFRIRESRMAVLTGEADNRPTDGQGLQLVLSQLQQQEDAYTALFKGESTVKTIKRIFQFQPTQANSKGEPVFRFSKRFGLVDADDLSGMPYYLTVDLLEDNRATPVVEGKREKGVVYLLPGKVRLAVCHNSKTLIEGVFQMGQFGREIQLPNNYFVGKRAGSATFDPITGSIKTYEQ
jgi:hypothetical protein